MKAGVTGYQSLWLGGTDGETLYVINQNRLPFVFEIVALHTPGEVIHAIESMIVRGAPVIGAAGACGVYLAALCSSRQSDPKKFIREWAEKLRLARPTAVNLARAVDRVYNKISGIYRNDERIRLAKQEALHIISEEVQACRGIGNEGLPLISEVAQKKNGKLVHILTHCNAGWLACIDYGTALAPIYLAHDAGIPVHVWVDETRPRNQGARLTAWELGEHGVPFTLIVDNAGGYLMQKGLVDMVMVGSDRTTLDGYVVNKIGTYLKALAAHDNHVPFYVAVPSSSFDASTGEKYLSLPIEEREVNEVTMAEGLEEGEMKTFSLYPANMPVANPGFDITPPYLVTALITERGICKPLKEEILNLFPEIKP